jgi:hypothetical protein
MPLFSFRTEVGGDLVGEGCRNLTPNSEWRRELLDGADAPPFRIRLVAETLALPFVLMLSLP